MKKFFLIMMMFLLSYQYTWAMVDAYDVHAANQANTQIVAAHFGHHVNCDDLAQAKTHVENKDFDAGSLDAGNPEAGKHAHCGFCHFSHGEIYTYRLPVFEATSVQFLSQYALVYHSPTFNTLERPKWPQPI